MILYILPYTSLPLPQQNLLERVTVVPTDLKNQIFYNYGKDSVSYPDTY